MHLYYSYRGTAYRNNHGTRSELAMRVKRLKAELAELQQLEENAQKKKWHEFMWGTVKSWAGARKTEISFENRIEQLQKELDEAESQLGELENSDSGIVIQAQALEHALSDKGNFFMAKNGEFVIVLEKNAWMLSAWKETASAWLCGFFDKYIHDSRADFIRGWGPFVYFRLRGIHEQMRPVAKNDTEKKG